MKNDLLLNLALERIEALEESWQGKRKHTRIIVGHTYAQNLRIIRERGDKETNNLLNLMLLGMPLELRKFIDSYYPTICLPVDNIVIDAEFNFAEFFRLERIKRKKTYSHFGSLDTTAFRSERFRKKYMLNSVVKLLARLGFKVVIEEIPTPQISSKEQ